MYGAVRTQGARLPKDPDDGLNVLNYMDESLKTLDAALFAQTPAPQYVTPQAVVSERFFRELMGGIAGLPNSQLQVGDVRQLQECRRCYHNEALRFLPQIVDAFCAKRGSVSLKTFHGFNTALFALAVSIYRVRLRDPHSERQWHFRSETELRRLYTEDEAVARPGSITPNTFLGCVLQLLDRVRAAYRDALDDILLHCVTLVRKQLGTVSVENLPAGCVDEEVKKRASLQLAVAYVRGLMDYVS